jgi:amino-acid N-acetyltransferase
MIRNAIIADARAIQSLVNDYAKKGEMIHLSLNEIYERIFEFIVYECDNKIVGCCALHPTWEDLAEIRSLAVDANYHGRDIGYKMVKHNLERAKKIAIKKIFALTYKPLFFEKLGFTLIEKELLPKKIWTDCLKCIKFPDCDESAVMIELKD